jgi:hypothetical protein
MTHSGITVSRTPSPTTPPPPVPAQRGASPIDIGSAVRAIRDSAAHSGDDGRRLLNDLAAALNGDRQGLLGVDLVTAYPPETLVPDRPMSVLSGTARLLSIIRDVLVFAPVAVTWWYLWHALRAPAQPGVSFLDSWRTGFGGQVTSLATAAYTVAVLVAAVATATLLVHLVEWAVELRSSQAGQRARLGQALALATLSLARRDIAAEEGEVVPMADVRKLVGQLQSSTSTLIGALERVGTTLDTGPTGGMAKALDEWSSAAHELGRLSQTIAAPNELLNRYLSAQERVSAQEKQMRAAIATLVQQIQEATSTAGARDEAEGMLAERIHELMTGFGERIQEFLDFTQMLQRSIEQLHEDLRAQTAGSFGGHYGGATTYGAQNGGLTSATGNGGPAYPSGPTDDGYEEPFATGGGR